MKPTLDYFFSETDDFYIPDVFKEIEYPWEAIDKAGDILKSTVVDNNICEIVGVTKGRVHFYDNYSIGRGTVIYNDVTIMGPVIIGENCEIMPGALIRPGTIIGNNCIIGHGCEIKRSVVQNFAKVQSMSFVGDSVIGKAARVGSGVIVANRNFNQSSIKVKANDFIKDLNTTFFGCVLGDNSRIGANAVTQPGTLIGPYSWIYPTTAVRGFIPACKRIYNKKTICMLDSEKIELHP